MNGDSAAGECGGDLGGDLLDDDDAIGGDGGNCAVGGDGGDCAIGGEGGSRAGGETGTGGALPRLDCEFADCEGCR